MLPRLMVTVELNRDKEDMWDLTENVCGKIEIYVES